MKRYVKIEFAQGTVEYEFLEKLKQRGINLAAYVRSLVTKAANCDSNGEIEMC